jgi:hypothetical protein
VAQKFNAAVALWLRGVTRPVPEAVLSLPHCKRPVYLESHENAIVLRLTAETSCPSVHFQESREVGEIVEELQRQNIAVFEIDGAALSSQEGIFKAFATALKKPKGCTEMRNTQTTLMRSWNISTM